MEFILLFGKIKKFSENPEVLRRLSLKKNLLRRKKMIKMLIDKNFPQIAFFQDIEAKVIFFLNLYAESQIRNLLLRYEITKLSRNSYYKVLM